jgi:cathepsin A (carboxypeptidase C)
MKAFALVSLLFVPAALAVPALELQSVLGEVDALSSGVFGGIAKGIERVAEGIFHDGKEKVEQWVEEGKEFVKQNGLVCEWLSSP